MTAWRQECKLLNRLCIDGLKEKRMTRVGIALLVFAVSAELQAGWITWTKTSILAFPLRKAQLTGTITANLPLHPDGSFAALENSYRDSLANGYLPGGSSFAILDLDVRENYRNVTTFNSGGGQITSTFHDRSVSGNSIRTNLSPRDS